MRQNSLASAGVATALALGYTGQRLARIETGEALACKTRYDKPGAVPSEHAKGKAVDIAAYQAANGLYLGVGVGRRGQGRWRFFSRREGRWRSTRSVRERRAVLADLRAHPEWVAEWTPDKRRYVHFEGCKREKGELRRALKYEPQPYPKRRSGSADHPGPRGVMPKRPLSNMALAMLLRRMNVDATAHGFRTSFRTWCSDVAHVPFEVAEASLSHRIGSAVSRAYARSDMLEWWTSAPPRI